MGDVPGAWLASAPLWPSLWTVAIRRGVTRTTGPNSEGHPAPLVVSKLSLRWALMEGQMVQLEETTPKIGRGELRRFLSRIKFVDSPYQVTSLGKKVCGYS